MAKRPKKIKTSQTATGQLVLTEALKAQKDKRKADTPVTDVLKQGRENAMTLERLKGYFQNCDKRQIFRLVESERRKGAPIMASKKEPYGYYTPKDEAEFKAFIHRRRAEEAHESETTDRMIEAWNEYWQYELSGSEFTFPRPEEEDE